MLEKQCQTLGQELNLERGQRERLQMEVNFLKGVLYKGLPRLGNNGDESDTISTSRHSSRVGLQHVHAPPSSRDGLIGVVVMGVVVAERFQVS